MTEQVIIAGAGGQGIMLLGKVLATAAMREDKFVTWFPSYGAEVRGGTAHCMVIISDREIGSPYVGKADTLIIMNAPSLEKFKSRGKSGSLLVLNSSLANAPVENKFKVVQCPFTDTAVRIGNLKVANMVALGCYLGHKKIVGLDSVLEAMQEIAPSGRKDLLEINELALKEGVTLK